MPLDNTQIPARFLAVVRKEGQKAGFSETMTDQLSTKLHSWGLPASQAQGFLAKVAPKLEGAKIMGLTPEKVAEVVTAAVSDPKADSADAFSELLYEKFVIEWQKEGDTVEHTPGPATAHGLTGVGRSWENGAGFRAKLVDGLTARLDPKHEPTLGREFAGMKLGDVAMAVAKANGERPFNVAQAVQMAGHTTSDFPLIVSDSMSNVVARQFDQREPDLVRVSREVERDTYHEGQSIALSASGMPQEIGEAGEIKFVTMDEKGENLPTPRDFGAGFNLTNRAIQNDRLDLLTQASDRMVRGAIERFRAVLLEPILANGGDGQTMNDGQAMFHSSHGNVATTSVAISVTGLDRARLAMRKQKDTQGQLYSVEPWGLLVPAELEGAGQKVLAELSATTVDEINPYSNTLQLIVEPNLPEDAWYLVGDPTRFDGLSHAFLEGQSAPRVETRPAWSTLGMEMRLIWAVDAKFIETASWYKTPVS